MSAAQVHTDLHTRIKAFIAAWRDRAKEMRMLTVDDAEVAAWVIETLCDELEHEVNRGD